MNQYLVDTRYAVENLFNILYQENKRLADTWASHKLMKTAEEELFKSGKKSGFVIEILMDVYGYGEAAKRFEVEARDIAQNLNNISLSLSIIAGSVLQIAKQGISIAYSNLSNCPSGRAVGPDSLKNIIWHGRNQALHFEEGKYHSQTVACFQKLETTYGSKFSLGRKNLALAVIEILDWTSYTKYEQDMSSLLP